MDDKRGDHADLATRRETMKQVDTSSTKKRSAATHGGAGRGKKARKTAPSAPSAPPAPSTPSPQIHGTPAVNRHPSRNNLINETIIYASDMETQIMAETRGVTRKNIPWDKFRSIYLCGFNVEAQPKLAVKSVKNIGEGTWEEKPFWNRLRKVLSNKVICDLKLFYSGTTTLSDTNKCKEVPSQPDFSLHVGEESPMWGNMEFLFEYARNSGQEAVTKKFSQWLRNAWSVFHHQPFRRHLYGIMFIQPCAYVCYADHGCAVYSEPLYFVKNNRHTQFLVDFLTGFIENSECRGRDPTVEESDDDVYIRHTEKRWAELPKGLLCYRPCLVGRHVRVALVRDRDAEFPAAKMVMKTTWEEKLPPESSPPSEVEVLEILLKANVRGLPQPDALGNAIVRDDDNLEIETRSFPENCEVALPASTTNLFAKMQKSYVSNHTSKPLGLGANVKDPLLRRVKTERQKFNEPLEVRGRLTRILMSYCVPLKEAMRNGNPESLMRTIRDAMIVYYEAYKLPKSGFIHGDISIENILVPVAGCTLTGGLTHKDRCGTIIDWNLCFTAHGTSSSRAFRSGTPAFMAPILLGDESIPRRTLSHDMESFFAIIIWIATLDYVDEAAFLVKPLAGTLLNQKADQKNIVNAKENWFMIPQNFRKQIINHFEPVYREDMVFCRCLIKLRKILYPIPPADDELTGDGLDENDNEETEDTDLMKEGLFRMCMKEIDDYLGETKGCDEMKWIDSRHTPESQQSQ